MVPSSTENCMQLCTHVAIRQALFVNTPVLLKWKMLIYITGTSAAVKSNCTSPQHTNEMGNLMITISYSVSAQNNYINISGCFELNSVSSASWLAVSTGSGTTLAELLLSPPFHLFIHAVLETAHSLSSLRLFSSTQKRTSLRWKAFQAQGLKTLVYNNFPCLCLNCLGNLRKP